MRHKPGILILAIFIQTPTSHDYVGFSNKMEVHFHFVLLPSPRPPTATNPPCSTKMTMECTRVAPDPPQDNDMASPISRKCRGRSRFSPKLVRLELVLLVNHSTGSMSRYLYISNIKIDQY